MDVYYDEMASLRSSMRKNLEEGNSQKEGTRKSSSKKKLTFSRETPFVEDYNIKLSILKHIYNSDRGCVQYIIKLIYRGVEWVIVKRYNDFAKLATQLVEEVNAMNLGVDLPALPKKRWFERQRWLNRFDETFGTRRQVELQMYLRQLVCIPELRQQSLAFWQFISMPKAAVDGARLLNENSDRASGLPCPPSPPSFSSHEHLRESMESDRDSYMEHLYRSRDSILEVQLGSLFDDDGNILTQQKDSGEGDGDGDSKSTGAANHNKKGLDAEEGAMMRRNHSGESPMRSSSKDKLANINSHLFDDVANMEEGLAYIVDEPDGQRHSAIDISSDDVLHAPPQAGVDRPRQHQHAQSPGRNGTGSGTGSEAEAGIGTRTGAGGMNNRPSSAPRSVGAGGYDGQQGDMPSPSLSPIVAPSSALAAGERGISPTPVRSPSRSLSSASASSPLHAALLSGGGGRGWEGGGSTMLASTSIARDSDDEGDGMSEVKRALQGVTISFETASDKGIGSPHFRIARRTSDSPSLPVPSSGSGPSTPAVSRSASGSFSYSPEASGVAPHSSPMQRAAVRRYSRHSEDGSPAPALPQPTFPPECSREDLDQIQAPGVLSSLALPTSSLPGAEGAEGTEGDGTAAAGGENCLDSAWNSVLSDTAEDRQAASVTTPNTTATATPSTAAKTGTDRR